jgi:hypothetical protein
MKKIDKLLYYLFGIVILSLGIIFILQSDLGAGAWDAFIFALGQKTNTSMGQWMIVVGICLIILNALLLRKKPDLLAFITIFILATTVDFWFRIVSIPSLLAIKIVFLSVGIVLMALGIAIYTKARFAVASVDLFMFTLSAVTGLSVRMSRILTEGCVLLLALLLEGRIGIGTILVTLLLGPFIQFFITNLTFAQGKKQPHS